MWTQDRLGWLALAWFEAFGARTLRKLRSYYRDGMTAFNAPYEELLSLGVLESALQRFVAWRTHVDPEAFARRCEAEDVRFILNCDAEYPAIFHQSSDPPAVLFVRGEIPALKRPLAVVGTRAMTRYGAQATELLCSKFVRAGCEIISGLALGIDAKAHETALENGGTTLAVLAGGCNDEAIYPRNNYPLAQRILEARGAIVTETPPGTESHRHLFPLRNRLIASLAVATIVVEAAESSGSLITAKLALEENREVFAVPGPITDERSRGPNTLLKMGAAPCTCAEDVLSLFDLPEQSAPVRTESVTREETEILVCLDRPLHIDELMRALKQPPAAVSSQLSTLELKGCVEHRGGGIYARTPAGKRVAEEAPEIVQN